MIRASFSLLAIALFSMGCADVQVKPVTAATDPGVRFYATRPYLLVTAAPGEHGVAYSTTVVYLPKIDEQYAVTIKPGLGTANDTLKLKEGCMLEELGATVDSKIPETLTAVGGLITAGAGVKSTTPTNPPMLETGLYRIEYVGANADHLVKVDLK